MNATPTNGDSEQFPPSRPPVPVREALLAAALHDVFTSCEHGPDSVDTWLNIATEATRWLTRPPSTGSRLPVFAIFHHQRTDAEYDAATGTIHITTGPLAGNYYPSPLRARHALTGHATTDTSETGKCAWRLTTRETR